MAGGAERDARAMAGSAEGYLRGGAWCAFFRVWAERPATRTRTDTMPMLSLPPIPNHPVALRAAAAVLLAFADVGSIDEASADAADRTMATLRRVAELEGRGDLVLFADALATVVGEFGW